MSFFGFNTDMPSGQHDSLDDRLRRMAEADENLEIYNWDDETGLQGADGLAGKLDETLDAFNDDTFGLGGGDVGKDFDFASNTAQFTGEPPQSKPQQQSHQQKKAAPSPFSVSFDADPLLGPARGVRQDKRQPGYNQPQRPIQQQQQQQQTYQHAQQQWGQSNFAAPFGQPAEPAPRKVRTLEEIEAQMQANQPQRPQAAPSPMQQARPSSRAPLTVEEVEAEMLKKAELARNQTGPANHAMARQHSSSQQDIQSLAQQAQAMAMRQQHPQQQTLPRDIQAPPAQQAQAPSQFAQRDDLLAQLLAATPRHPQGADGRPLDPVKVQQSEDERMRSHAANEDVRRKKAAKIHRMAKHNGLMTQGDKDFITRIQVSQLINSNGPNGTHDPYSDDFYFAVMQSMRQSRMAALQGSAPPGIMQGPPAGPPAQASRGRQSTQEKRMSRRENAMNRMAQQVQRLVDDAKKKPRATQLSLEGALGKIAVRTRSAPRPLLQVDNKRSSVHSLDGPDVLSAADLAGSLTAALPKSTSGKHAALSRRETLAAIEHLYDVVLKLEQARRPMAPLAAAAEAEQAAEQAGQPVSRDARDALRKNEADYNGLVEEMWTGLKVMEPLDVSSPHPFISIISVSKGKKLLPRLLRHTSYQQTLILLTLLVATFDTLDVVREAAVLDMSPADPAFYATEVSRGSAPLHTASPKKTRKQVAMETELFLNVAIPLVMGVIGKAQLRIVTGMLGLLIERNDFVRIVKTKPGLAFLTVFISGAETLKSSPGSDDQPKPEQSEISQWIATFNHLISRLSGHLPSLFPSSRSMPFGAGMYAGANSATAESILDAEDEPVWHFLAALAVSADMTQQQQLVTEVRDKVIENVLKAKNAQKQVNVQGPAAESLANAKIKNVNTFLHALGLDAGQITAE